MAASRLEDQDNRNRELESKSVSLVGIGALLTSMGVLSLLDFSMVPEQGLSRFSIGAIIGLGAAFLVVLLTALFVLWPRTWVRNPDLKKFMEYLEAGRTDDELNMWAGDEVCRNLKSNESKVTCKSWGVTASVVGVVVLAAALASLAVSLRI